MNALEARKKYFEKHVDFEHCLRLLAQSLMIKTTHKSLGSIIEEVASNKKFMFLGLSASSLRAQKYSRNGLGHMYANSKASDKLIKRFECIDDINQRLMEARKGVLEDSKKSSKKPAS